jgi:hypothetical protein
MAELKKDEEVVTEEPVAEDDGYVKPDPSKAPRNISLGEIAAQVAKDHLAEIADNAKIPSVNEDGTPSELATEEPAGEPEPEAATPLPDSSPEPKVEAAPALAEGAIDPKGEYEVTVDGQKMKVPGQKIIDAGYRTFQKETAADFRLNVATELMQEAERRMAEAKGAKPADAEKPAVDGPSDADLAKAMQFGTPEEAEKAMSTLRGRGFDQKQITGLVVQQSRQAARDELAFQDALKFVKTEYSDLLSNDHLKRLFFVEENRYRTPKDKGGLGDTRPYAEVYKDIGDSLRKSLNLTKPAPTSDSPTSTAAGRREVKASKPPIPKTAASRLSEAPAAKAKGPSEIIADMAARRGQTRLNPLNKE